MKIKNRLLIVVVALIVALGFAVQPAMADEHMFNVSVYHNIDGTRLGLSEDLPVDIYIYDGAGRLLSIIAGFTYKERIDTQLPAGVYEIRVYSHELDSFVPSMTVGPTEIPGGVDVRLQARLGVGKTPIIGVKVNGEPTNLDTIEETIPSGAFDVFVFHNIDGTKLGLSEDLPVDIYVYAPAGLIGYFPNFTYGEKISTQLPAGNYEIMVYSQELGTFVPSMTVGPVEIPGGVEVRLQAKLEPGKTPVTNVKVK
jgi:hypothetical protein